ncbi:unnamed protein product [Boreogadus saida]
MTEPRPAVLPPRSQRSERSECVPARWRTALVGRDALRVQYCISFLCQRPFPAVLRSQTTMTFCFLRWRRCHEPRGSTTTRPSSTPPPSGCQTVSACLLVPIGINHLTEAHPPTRVGSALKALRIFNMTPLLAASQRQEASGEKRRKQKPLASGRR